jgi:hypothetical protein
VGSREVGGPLPPRGLGNWGQWTDGAAARAGDNGTMNQDWMADHGFIPVESSLNTP